MKSHSQRGINFKEAEIFGQGSGGRRGYDLPFNGLSETEISVLLPEDMIRDDLSGFPRLSEPEVIRHYTRMSQWNFSVDTNMYPLGSCTMKHNPRVNEAVARFTGFTNLHPLQDDVQAQ